MPDNATLNQSTQIGAESTWGVDVPATKRLRAMNIALGSQMETDTYFPAGNIIPSSAALIQEWAEGDIEGVLTYTEIVYALSMLFGPATITTPAGGTLSRKWVWAPAANAVLAPVSMTVEKGSSVYAYESSGVIATGFNIGWNRTDRIEIGGSVLGKAINKGTTLTSIGANPTVPLQRVLPTQIGVFSDPTFAGLGTTRLLRAFEAGISIDNLYAGVWPLNNLITGHDGFVSTQPDTESTLLLMADAAGLAFLDVVRAGQTRYLRILAEGPIIETTIKYTFQVDMAIQVTDVDTFDDADGIWAIPWTFTPVDDGINPPITITVINTQLAL